MIRAFKPMVPLLLGSVMLIGCASQSTKVDKNNESTAYYLYNKNKPEITVANTGIASGNLVTAGIAKAYRQTIKLEDKYKSSIENNKVALIIEKIRLEQGEDAYKKAFNELNIEDKAEYNKFLESNINELEVALEYTVAASAMAVGVLKFSYFEYIFNPFAVTKIKSAINFKATFLSWIP